MKYLLVLAAVLMMGCKMPGVGELEERVDELESTTVYDDSDLVDRVEYVEDEIVMIDQRVTSLEMGEVAQIPVMPEQGRPPVQEEGSDTTPVEQQVPAMEDIPGLIDRLDGIESAVFDSMTVLDGSLAELYTTVEDLSIAVDSLTLGMDSLTVENDSLKVRMEELEETVQDLSYTVSSLRTSSTSSTSSTGGRGSTSTSTGGRGGTTSTTTSTGGR
jgi:archaellum component FlaC